MSVVDLSEEGWRKSPQASPVGPQPKSKTLKRSAKSEPETADSIKTDEPVSKKPKEGSPKTSPPKDSPKDPSKTKTESPPKPESKKTELRRPEGKRFEPNLPKKPEPDQEEEEETEEEKLRKDNEFIENDVREVEESSEEEREFTEEYGTEMEKKERQELLAAKLKKRNGHAEDGYYSDGEYTTQVETEVTNDIQYSMNAIFRTYALVDAKKRDGVAKTICTESRVFIKYTRKTERYKSVRDYLEKEAEAHKKTIPKEKNQEIEIILGRIEIDGQYIAPLTKSDDPK